MFRKKESKDYEKLEDTPSTKIENVPLNKTFDTETSSHATGNSAIENWSRYAADKAKSEEGGGGAESDLSSLNQIASFDLDESVGNATIEGDEFEVIYSKASSAHHDSSSKGEDDFQVIYTQKSDDKDDVAEEESKQPAVVANNTESAVVGDEARISERARSLFLASSKNSQQGNNNETPASSDATPESEPAKAPFDADSSVPDLYTEDKMDNNNNTASQESGQNTVEEVNDAKKEAETPITEVALSEQVIQATLSEDALNNNNVSETKDTEHSNKKTLIAEIASTIKAKNTGAPRDTASVLSMHCRNIEDMKSYLERWKEDRPFDEETLGYAASLYQTSERGGFERGIDGAATEDVVPPMPKDFFQAVSAAAAAGAEETAIPPGGDNPLSEMVKGSYDDALSKQRRRRRRYGIIIACCVVLIIASIVAIVVSSKNNNGKNDDKPDNLPPSPPPDNEGGKVSSSSAINPFNLTLGFPLALNSSETDQVGNDLESVLPGYLTQTSTSAGESEITGYVFNVTAIPNNDNADRRGLQQQQDPDYMFSVTGVVNLETPVGESVVDPDEVLESVDSTVNQACSNEEAFAEYVSANSDSDLLKSSTGVSVETETHFSPSPSDAPFSSKPTTANPSSSIPSSRVPSSSAPTSMPTPLSNSPTAIPVYEVSKSPTVFPTSTPSQRPTLARSSSPTASPTAAPTKVPTNVPTKEPTESPTTAFPTKEPTESPTSFPTKEPTENPTSFPTEEPTESPTSFPTKEPTDSPTSFPTKEPTESPTSFPTNEPTESPTTESPTSFPTEEPTESPTTSPTCFSAVSAYRACYPYLDGTIRVGFASCDPQEGDWVGLYNTKTASLVDNSYDAWKFTCGDRFCDGSPSSGILEFRARNLDPGESYQAILMRGQEEGPPPYTALAASPRVFTVRARC